MRNLVLLPGFMLNEHLWDDMRDDLATLGSLTFGDLGQDIGIQAMADAVLRQAPERFVLLGFSMGGFVAQAIALKAPERVLGLGLLNTSSRPQTERESQGTLAQLDMARRTPFKGLTSRALASSLHPARSTDRTLLDRLQAMALANGKEVFLRQLQTLRDSNAEELQQLQCPVLIVSSDEDKLRSVEESEEMARRIPQSRLEIIGDSGHMTPMEKPQELFAILSDWITRSGL
ncbi:alpha/beta hydrolase superfamily protein [Herbaspirillum frisingense GSF30]|uniref:Alpha/beta hydrolase superfamily protein n=1 Tax=Herbaspirillum frisingense GSF30 TaxID=864073 RepID=A0AAI9ICG7_9BURK|nr:alpha/beta hydrolase [Herbaspirillum frisingense]EOA03570.1 alpha/beta hydrolase superfamily protein [Herbaspirillum frisingense GSF30]